MLSWILKHKDKLKDKIKDKFINISKKIRLLRKLQKLLTRSSLLTIYKSFIKPHLDYGNITYNKAYNTSHFINLV